MDVWQAVAAFIAAFAASTAFIMSLLLFRETRQTTKLQMRAYVGVDSIELNLPGLLDPNYQPVVPNKPGLVCNDYVALTIRNFGNTPAIDVTISVSWQPIPFGAMLPADFSYPDRESITTPGIERVISKHQLVQDQRHTGRVPIFDVQSFGAAQQQKVTAYVYGHVDYRDTFGRKWRRSFSYIYEPWLPVGGQFTPDRNHNGETKL